MDKKSHAAIAIKYICSSEVDQQNHSVDRQEWYQRTEDSVLEEEEEKAGAEVMAALSVASSRGLCLVYMERTRHSYAQSDLIVSTVQT